MTPLQSSAAPMMVRLDHERQRVLSPLKSESTMPKTQPTEALAAEMKGKSLGEKLFDANATLTGTGFRWRDLHAITQTDHEKVALAFAASLSHDETATAVIAAQAEEIVAQSNLITELDARLVEAERVKTGYQHHLRACEQIAGKALGYPWFKDDQANFPDATEADGVSIGDPVGDTIVSELAKRLVESEAREAETMTRLSAAVEEWSAAEAREGALREVAERVEALLMAAENIDHTKSTPTSSWVGDYQAARSDLRAALTTQGGGE